jgi:DNA (cytosine-5)-methyltransferase 1
LRSIAVCERDAFVVANMVSKMEKGLLDSVPIWTDVTDFPTEPFGRGVLDLFIASYPCQGFSHAGKRLGTDDHRHLWPYCRKFIGAVRPGWVWLENVEGHVSLGLSTVLADLEEDGYAAAWGIFSASEVGAPHQRKRVFILAYDNSGGRAPRFQSGGGVSVGAWPSRPGCAQHGWEPPRVVRGDYDRIATSNRRFSPEEARLRAESIDRSVGNAGLLRQEVGCLQTAGTVQYGGENSDGQTQPPLGGNADGITRGLDFARCTSLSNQELAEIRGWMVKGTNRTDELRLCGNGVVPQTAERAFRVLYAELTTPKI